MSKSSKTQSTKTSKVKSRKKPKSKKSNAGRKKIPINWADVDKLCFIQCTQEEIAGVLGVSIDTLERRMKEDHGMNFAEYFTQKSAGGRASLRRRQYQKAITEGNPTMLIWLGKQWLGQTDKQETEVSHSGGFVFIDDNDPSAEGKV